ncbi:double-strand-break repair protein rad21-like protein 1 [Thomomys bottae]
MKRALVMGCTHSSIDAPEYFTQNQSRPEEITLKEDYGGVSQILRGQSFEEENALPSCSVALSAHGTGSLSGEDSLMFNSGDGFGDEGAAEPTIDFLWNGDGNCLLEDMPLEEKLPLTPEPHQNTLNNSDGACFSSDDTCFPKTGQMDATTITAEQEGFSLPLVDVSGTSGTRKRKRRRLLIDPVKELSSQRICEQFTSCEDTLKAFEIAPPTRKLMLLKERNKASTLLSTPCQCLASDHLKKLFSNCLSSSALTPRRSMKRKLEEEDESCETHDISTMEEANSQEQLNLPPIQKHVTQVPKDLSSKNSKDLLNSKEDLLNSRKVPKAVRKNGTMCHVLATLQEYNKMGLRSFSLKELCKYNNPKEVAARFSSLLILAKKQVVELNQSSPYGDILVTVGPKFHDV